MKQFNINNYVKVKLNEEGINILKQYHLELFGHLDYLNLNIDENGYCEMLMWEVMKYFGKYLFNGSKVHPIDTNIKIEDKYLEEEPKIQVPRTVNMTSVPVISVNGEKFPNLTRTYLMGDTQYRFDSLDNSDNNLKKHR